MKYELAGGEGEYILGGKQLHHSVFNIHWLENPKVILDVGAFDFGDSLRFKNGFPECEVYAFEMDKRNYNAHRLFAEYRGVHTYNVAVSNQNGFSDFYESHHTGGVNAQSSLLEPAQTYRDNYQHIVNHKKADYQTETITLESFCQRNSILDIDLVHCDVEGAEFEVIEGLGTIRPKMIFAEFLLDGGWVGQKKFEKTLELLRELGYNLVGSYSFDKLFMLSE